MNRFQKPLPDCLIFLLAKAYQKAHARFKRLLQPYGLTNIQHLVLEGLWYEEGQTAAELGELLILDKATLSGVLDRMEKADWIRKVEHSEDRRICKLFPSDKANGLKEELIALRQSTNEEILSPFSLEEQVLLKRLLKDLS